MLGGGRHRLLVSGRRRRRAPGLRVREQNLLLVEGVGETPLFGRDVQRRRVYRPDAMVMGDVAA